MFTAAGGYIVLATLILEIISLLQPAFNISIHSYTIVTYILVGFFPINTGLSWFFDITLEGIVKTPTKQQEDTASTEVS